MSKAVAVYTEESITETPYELVPVFSNRQYTSPNTRRTKSTHAKKHSLNNSLITRTTDTVYDAPLGNTNSVCCSKISLTINDYCQDKKRPRSGYRRSPLKIYIKPKVEPRNEAKVAALNFEKLDCSKLRIRKRREQSLTPHRRYDRVFGEYRQKMQRYTLLRDPKKL